jgi:hypothetical protein
VGEGEFGSASAKVAQERTRPGGDANTHDLARWPGRFEAIRRLCLEARPPATSAAWVNQPMTTMIRKCRALVAASLLTAVIMSFPTPTASEAMVERDVIHAPASRICPIDWRQSAWHVKQLIRCAATHFGVGRNKALYIAWRESRFRPSAYNAAGNAAGIYQHLLKYWPHRAEDYGFRDWSAFNARANIIVTMRMVRHYGWDPWGG